MNYKHTFVICHERVNAGNHKSFIGEYERWVKAINKISPDAMLCGHEHTCKIFPKGQKHFETDTVIEFDTVVTGQVRGNKRTTNANLPKGYTGGFFTLTDDELKVAFTNDVHEIESEHVIKL